MGLHMFWCLGRPEVDAWFFGTGIRMLACECWKQIFGAQKEKEMLWINHAIWPQVKLNWKKKNYLCVSVRVRSMHAHHCTGVGSRGQLSHCFLPSTMLKQDLSSFCCCTLYSRASSPETFRPVLSLPPRSKRSGRISVALCWTSHFTWFWEI